ncbi:MAG: GDSL-type esterase/lipase family protein [Algoriphagus sp.]|nr:GDSL-type esterase/lipase family protein [Algoriphagus sp.]
MKKSIFLVLVFLSSWSASIAQQHPFEEEVRRLSARLDSIGWNPGATVFTGSSTIRMWHSLPEVSVGTEVLNTGFGGSKALDLERYLFPLVLKFDPERVFIYEGDNDLWAGVPSEDILNSLKQIVTRIHLVDPGTEIVLIGAKPSPSRWEKKESYQTFNQLLRVYCDQAEQVTYLDTWRALTDEQGNPRPELYLQDQLHLNAKGYLVWNQLFTPFFTK